MPGYPLPCILSEWKKPRVNCTIKKCRTVFEFNNWAVDTTANVSVTLSSFLLPFKGPATDPALWTAPQEDLLCSCSTSCSLSPPASRPITTWCDCRPSRSPASCKSVRLLPYSSKNQRRVRWAGCLASETRWAGGSSSPCGLWTDRD